MFTPVRFLCAAIVLRRSRLGRCGRRRLPRRRRRRSVRVVRRAPLRIEVMLVIHIIQRELELG